MATRTSRTSAGVKVGCARLDVGPEGWAVPDGVPSDRAGGRDQLHRARITPRRTLGGELRRAGPATTPCRQGRQSMDLGWRQRFPQPAFSRLRPNERRPNSSPRLREGQAARTAAAQHAALRTRTKHHKPALLALVQCPATRGSVVGVMAEIPRWHARDHWTAGGALLRLEETQPMTWIIIALLFAAAAAAGFRLQALTRDEPPEPPLAHRWRRTMGGG